MGPQGRQGGALKPASTEKTGTKIGPPAGRNRPRVRGAAAHTRLLSCSVLLSLPVHSGGRLSERTAHAGCRRDCPNLSPPRA